jgi:hypothetical protein
MTKHSHQSVDERIAGAMAYLIAENRLQTTSVVEFCRIADVSRANLYVHHPEVLASLRCAGSPSPRVSRKKNSRPIDQQDTINALRAICIELALEVHQLRQKVASLETDRSGRSRTPAPSSK